MAKAETEEKHLARKSREAKELSRRKKELDRKNPAGYLWYLLVVPAIILLITQVHETKGIDPATGAEWD